MINTALISEQFVPEYIFELNREFSAQFGNVKYALFKYIYENQEEGLKPFRINNKRSTYVIPAKSSNTPLLALNYFIDDTPHEYYFDENTIREILKADIAEGVVEFCKTNGISVMKSAEGEFRIHPSTQRSYELA